MYPADHEGSDQKHPTRRPRSFLPSSKHDPINIYEVVDYETEHRSTHERAEYKACELEDLRDGNTQASTEKVGPVQPVPGGQVHIDAEPPSTTNPFARFGIVFVKFMVVTSVYLLSLFIVPLKPMETSNQFNDAFWALIASTFFVSPVCPIQQFMVFIAYMTPTCKLDIKTDRVLRWRLYACILFFFIVIMLAVIILRSFGHLPFPFQGAVIGGFAFILTIVSFMRSQFQYHVPTFDRKSLWFVTRCVVDTFNLPLSVLAVEQLFITGMYLYPENQYLWVILFQMTITMYKFLVRIIIRKRSKDLNLAHEESDNLILGFYTELEFVLQFYLATVSSNIHDLNVLGFFLCIEALSLAITPILDSFHGRAAMKTILKTMFPSKADIINNSLSIHNPLHRQLALEVCASNFFVRVASSLHYIVIGTFMYFGYNKDSFSTFKYITLSEFRVSIIFSFTGLILAVVQFLITRKIMLRVYKMDMLELWSKRLEENFTLITSLIGAIFVQSMLSILEQYKSISYILDLSNHHKSG